MDYSFPHYLLAKQTVDDRALNKDVVAVLRLRMSAQPVSVTEVGAGIGTMLKRLVEWKMFCAGEYVLVDEQPGNIAYAREWIPQWAAEAGLRVERTGQDELRLCDRDRDILVRLECTDVFDFIGRNAQPADILIAHAFLDLLPLPESLEKLFSLTRGLAWLTINFDGISALLPVIDLRLDANIERLYHASMDARSTGGDSHTGSKLFHYLRCLDAQLLAAGASDWVVYAPGGSYFADEKYFLEFILHFIESALNGCDELEADAFARWLVLRRRQIECGELVYIAHQMDFLVRVNASE